MTILKHILIEKVVSSLRPVLFFFLKKKIPVF